MSLKLNWEHDGADWPNHAASRIVSAAGFRWHVQIMGRGPVLLALHGTGASTHSWRDLAPLLAQHFTVVAPDLPGHGFTATPDRHHMSLQGIARSLGVLLKELDLSPEVAIGHSAGAAIMVRMALDGIITPRLLVSLNGALLPLPSMPSELFSPLARVMASVPFLPQFAAWQAGSMGAVEQMIRSSGSKLDDRGIALYRRLVSNPGHVAGALEMMAEWNLRAFGRDLPSLKTPLLQIVGGQDGTIPPEDAKRIEKLLPHATTIKLPGLGHLAHEEDAAAHAALIIEAAARG